MVNKLRWRHFFSKQENKSKDWSADIASLTKKLNQNKTTKKAPIAHSHALELFIEKVYKDAHDHKCKSKYKSPDNLTKECRTALNSLKKLYSEHDVIIRPFDKGTGFFLLNTEDYVDRTMVHLSDTTKYMVIENPREAALKTIEDINNWTVKFATEPGMTASVIERVIPDIDKQNIGKFYLNPKAHKPPLYPGRLITTCCNAYIENLSALTAHELKKVNVPYVIKDSQEFLRKIDELNASNILRNKTIIHVSIDVVNMFPNIPREFGIVECTKHLNKRPTPSMLFSTECIVEALKITLDNNIASFNSTAYKQLQGTAMGPKTVVIMQM